MESVSQQKAANASPKEAAKLQKEVDLLWDPRQLLTAAPLLDGVVDFFIKNSPSAEVKIIDCWE